jgi:AcrR family transcriptional regulator
MTREPTPGVKARDRILDSAYELFSRHGVRAIGIDAIIKHSGVARMTLYRNFRSKDALVLAFLDKRARSWTRDWLQAEVERRAREPRARLLAIFDVFGEWFERDDFEGCSFINVMLEHAGDESAIQTASVRYLADIREFIERVARAAGIADTPDFARKWHILMKGAIVAASEGDRKAATRARELGRLLLEST